MLQASGPWWGGLEKACPNKNYTLYWLRGTAFQPAIFFYSPNVSENGRQAEARALSHAAKKNRYIIAEDDF